MNGHTPGPWIAHETEVYFSNSYGGLSVRGCPDAKANARLIAAAPELLGILENLVGLARLGAANLGKYHAALEDAEAIIAKAKGEA